MKKPKIELKNIRVHNGLSQETWAYTATVYVDGKRWGTVENDGHGGPDNPSPDKGGWEEVKRLDNKIKATFPKRVSEYFPEGREEDLESVCCDLVNEWQRKKQFRSLLRKIVMIEDGEVYNYPAKVKPTPGNIDMVKIKHPKATVLNDLSFQEAFDKFLECGC